jgi:hypothetical protein
MKIYNKELRSHAFETICSLVREKATFCSLDDDYIERELRKILEQNTQLIAKLNESNKQAVKTVVKDIRNRFHDTYELFNTQKIKKRQEILTRIDKGEPFSEEQKKRWDMLLSFHRSTQERLAHYEAFYEALDTHCDSPQSILDISCGHNPCSLYYLQKRRALSSSFSYYATEFCYSDVAFIDSVLETYGIRHDTKRIDLANEPDKLNTFEDVDCALLLKVLDVTETLKRNSTYEILKEIPSKTIVASFSTKNIRNRPLMLQDRPWMKRMCENLGYTFATVALPNELLYIIKKPTTSK